MSKTSKYFLKLVKDVSICPNDICLCIKNLKIDEHGHRYWDLMDELEAKKFKTAKHFKCVSIIGLIYPYSEYTRWFNASSDDTAFKRSYPFEWSWLEWGSFTFNVSSIPDNSTLHTFLESVFNQMMLASERGENVFIDHELFIKKDTAYQHMMNADLMLE